MPKAYALKQGDLPDQIPNALTVGTAWGGVDRTISIYDLYMSMGKTAEL